MLSGLQIKKTVSGPFVSFEKVVKTYSWLQMWLQRDWTSPTSNMSLTMTCPQILRTMVSMMSCVVVLQREPSFVSPHPKIVTLLERTPTYIAQALQIGISHCLTQPWNVMRLVYTHIDYRTIRHSVTQWLTHNVVHYIYYYYYALLCVLCNALY